MKEVILFTSTISLPASDPKTIKQQECREREKRRPGETLFHVSCSYQRYCKSTGSVKAVCLTSTNKLTTVAEDSNPARREPALTSMEVGEGEWRDRFQLAFFPAEATNNRAEGLAVREEGSPQAYISETAFTSC